MYYTSEGVTTSCMAAAIARCCLHDCLVNNFTFSGFPSVEVVDEKYELGVPNGRFKIVLRFGDRFSVGFVDRGIMFTAAKLHSSKNPNYCKNLFKLVQPMIIELECFEIE